MAHGCVGHQLIHEGYISSLRFKLHVCSCQSWNIPSTGQSKAKLSQHEISFHSYGLALRGTSVLVSRSFFLPGTNVHFLTSLILCGVGLGSELLVLPIEPTYGKIVYNMLFYLLLLSIMTELISIPILSPSGTA